MVFHFFYENFLCSLFLFKGKPRLKHGISFLSFDIYFIFFLCYKKQNFIDEKKRKAVQGRVDILPWQKGEYKQSERQRKQ